MPKENCIFSMYIEGLLLKNELSKNLSLLNNHLFLSICFFPTFSPKIGKQRKVKRKERGREKNTLN